MADRPEGSLVLRRNLDVVERLPIQHQFDIFQLNTGQVEPSCNLNDHPRI